MGCKDSGQKTAEKKREPLIFPGREHGFNYTKNISKEPNLAARTFNDGGVRKSKHKGARIKTEWYVPQNFQGPAIGKNDAKEQNSADRIKMDYSHVKEARSPVALTPEEQKSMKKGEQKIKSMLWNCIPRTSADYRSFHVAGSKDKGYIVKDQSIERVTATNKKDQDRISRLGLKIIKSSNKSMVQLTDHKDNSTHNNSNASYLEHSVNKKDHEDSKTRYSHKSFQIKGDQPDRPSSALKKKVVIYGIQTAEKNVFNGTRPRSGNVSKNNVFLNNQNHLKGVGMAKGKFAKKIGKLVNPEGPGQGGFLVKGRRNISSASNLKGNSVQDRSLNMSK